MSNLQQNKKRYAVIVVVALFAIGIAATVGYFTGKTAGRTPEVVEGTAQVLASQRLVLEPETADDFAGGAGPYDVNGAYWTADGVTHGPADGTPPCLVPGSRPRLRLSMIEVNPAERTGPGRWMVTHVECLP